MIDYAYKMDLEFRAVIRSVSTDCMDETLRLSIKGSLDYDIWFIKNFQIYNCLREEIRPLKKSQLVFRL